MTAAGIVFALAACGQQAPPPAVAPPAPAVAPVTPATETPVAAEPVLGELAWDNLFDTVEGWYDSDDDKKYGATISSEAGGKARLLEIGGDVWGKAIVIVKDIDFSRNPILTAVVGEVSDGSSWNVGVCANPWNDADYHVVIPSQNKTGSFTGDLAKMTGWTGKKGEINLVIVVEGNSKSIVFDSLHINYTK
jgi:hypothetical protein